MKQNANLPGILWEPKGKWNLILLVVHGMTEHFGRYEAFARQMNKSGIAVAGFDLPGHGQNPGDPDCASLGENGWAQTLNRISELDRALSRNYPGIPRALMGFSLGSFLVRDYLSVRSHDFSGAVILGSGDQPSFVLTVLKALIRGQIRKVGFDRSTPLVQKLSFGAYNQKFAPNRTQADWLCADAEALDGYLADPLCRKSISAGLFWQLLDGMQRTGKDDYRTWNRKMPVLLLSGEDDPVGSGGKGMKALARKMESGGMAHVTLRLIPGARHDVLHEDAGGRAEEAIAAIRQFLAGI